jgi:hypothetical protein
MEILFAGTIVAVDFTAYHRDIGNLTALGVGHKLGEWDFGILAHSHAAFNNVP